MNQILVVEDTKNKNKRNSGPIEIYKAVRFFAIIIAVFGIVFVGKGSYAIYKETKNKNTDNMPIVEMDRINDKVKITASGVNKIINLKYKWNDAEETVIPVENTMVEESDILLPNEDSILSVTIEEEGGRSIKYEKRFIIQGLDIIPPQIDIVQGSTNGSIKIVATDETAMDYITYKIDEEEEILINSSSLETKTMNYVLNLPIGKHKIVAVAVDTSGNRKTKEKEVELAKKSDINVILDGGKATVVMKDYDGIKDIEINLNGVVYTKKDINQQELKVVLDLVRGVNTIKVTMKNINSRETVGAKEINYEP